MDWDDEVGDVDAGEILDKTENDDETDNMIKPIKALVERGRGSDNFWIATSEKVFVTGGDKHNKKDNSGKNHDKLKNIIKETFETLDSGNAGKITGTDAFAIDC